MQATDSTVATQSRLQQPDPWCILGCCSLRGTLVPHLSGEPQCVYLGNGLVGWLTGRAPPAGTQLPSFTAFAQCACCVWGSVGSGDSETCLQSFPPSSHRNCSPEKRGAPLGGGVALRLQLGCVWLPISCSFFVNQLRPGVSADALAQAQVQAQEGTRTSLAPDWVSEALPPLNGSRPNKCKSGARMPRGK